MRHAIVAHSAMSGNFLKSLGNNGVPGEEQLAWRQQFSLMKRVIIVDPSMKGLIES